ncbi:MAG: hypothetical protein QM726_10320 [Chitinophagaceae bacterium]
MKYLFFLTILFSAAAAKAQLPPVRTSDPAGSATEKTIVPLRSGGNASALSTERTAATSTTSATTDMEVPIRKTDNVSNTSNAAAARTTNTLNNDASKLPIRSSDPQAKSVAAVIEKVPLRSSDTVGKDSTTNSLQNANAAKKLLFPSEHAVSDSTKTSL